MGAAQIGYVGGAADSFDAIMWACHEAYHFKAVRLATVVSELIGGVGILLLPAAGYANGVTFQASNLYWSSVAAANSLGVYASFNASAFNSAKTYVSYARDAVRLATVVSESAIELVFCSCLLREPGLVLTSVM